VNAILQKREIERAGLVEVKCLPMSKFDLFGRQWPVKAVLANNDNILVRSDDAVVVKFLNDTE